ncbi:MAG: hypothetical protein KDA83_05380, partial [Planctomycetales bacterium]|nr:hypothetical protein [Planctomycetales bacterium]
MKARSKDGRRIGADAVRVLGLVAPFVGREMPRITSRSRAGEPHGPRVLTVRGGLELALLGVLAIVMTGISAAAQEPPFTEEEREALRLRFGDGRHDLRLPEQWGLTTLSPPDDRGPVEFRFEPELRREGADRINGPWHDVRPSFEIPPTEYLTALYLSPARTFALHFSLGDPQGRARRSYRDGRQEIDQFIRSVDKPDASARRELTRLIDVVKNSVRQELPPDAHARLPEIAWQATAYEATLHQLLIDGWLGESLGVTDEQKDELRNSIEIETTRLRDELIALEREQLNRYLAVMDDAAEQRFRNRFGEQSAWECLPLPTYRYLYDNFDYIEARKKGLESLPEEGWRYLIEGHEVAEREATDLLLNSAEVHAYIGVDQRARQQMEVAYRNAEQQLGDLIVRQMGLRSGSGNQAELERLSSTIEQQRLDLPRAPINALEGDARLRAE